MAVSEMGALDGRQQAQRTFATKRDPLARPKLAELVQNRLLAVIKAENLRPGDPLPSERELMQSYAVGRPSIREAMQNLKRMGLIEINHGERPRVAAPSFERMVADMSETMRHVLMNSPATLDHLKEARASFEMTIAQIAARKRTVEDVDDLRRILDEQEQARLDSNAFLEADGRFHHRIAVITGNPIFAHLSQALFAWLVVRIIRKVVAGARIMEASAGPIFAALTAGIAAACVVEVFDFDLRIPAIALMLAVVTGLLVRLTTTGSGPPHKSASRPWAITLLSLLDGSSGTALDIDQDLQP